MMEYTFVEQSRFELFIGVYEMEHFRALLKELEQLTFCDIATIPVERQHDVAEQIEQLQDQLLWIIEHASQSLEKC